MLSTRLIAGLVVSAAAMVATLMLMGSGSEASNADREAILLASRDYGDGWYEAADDRMARALHPELAKRVVYQHPLSGYSKLHDMGAMSLVRGTKAGGGSRAPVEIRSAEIEILDVFENAASVKVSGPEWVDYLHLAKWNGKWLIVNVLWEPNSENRERLAALLSGTHVPEEN